MNNYKYQTENMIVSDNKESVYYASLYLVHESCIILHIIFGIYWYFILNMVSVYSFSNM